MTHAEMMQNAMQKNEREYVNSRIYNDKGEELTQEQKERYWRYLNG